jgi:hypothetical protein
MKTGILVLCIALCISDHSSGQSAETTDHVIEGGKLIVELVKALNAKKDTDRDTGCKGKYADLCIENESPNSIAVYLEHRGSTEKREVIILPEGKECALQARIGVWTYDLKITGVLQSLRKGDLLIEGCNNLVMNIK